MTLIQKTLLLSTFFLLSCQSVQLPLFSDRPSYKERHAELEREKAKKRASEERARLKKTRTSTASTGTKVRKNAPNRTHSKSTAEVKKQSIRSEVVKEAHKYVGIPYNYGGKKPHGGFDCSGFSTFVFAQKGIKIDGSSRTMSKMGIPVSFNNIKSGDLAFFGTNGKVTHVAIVVSKTNKEFKVLHSTSSKGVIGSDILHSEYWMGKYLFSRDVLTNFDYGYTGLD